MVVLLQDMPDTNSSVTSLYLEVCVLIVGKSLGKSPYICIPFVVQVLAVLCTPSLLQASNSSTYVQDAFQLLLPVLKLIQIQQLSSEVPQPNVLSRT